MCGCEGSGDRAPQLWLRKTECLGALGTVRGCFFWPMVCGWPPALAGEDASVVEEASAVPMPVRLRSLGRGLGDIG